MIKAVLADVCLIHSGGTPSRGNHLYWGGSISWAKISDLEASGDGYISSTEENITEQGLEAIRGRVFNDGTLLFAIYGSVGKMAVVRGSVSANQAILGIEPDTSRLDLNYLKFWLRSQQHRFDQDAQGVAQKNLSAGYVRSLEIPLPPLPEQKRIAAILDKADAIRLKRQQAIKIADDFLRAVFLEMFGDPVTNPKGWNVREVGGICGVQGGLQVSKKRTGLPFAAPYLRVANVLRNRLDLTEVREIELFESEYLRVKLAPEDILIVEGHGNPGEIGRCAMWEGEVDGVVHQNHLIRVRVKSKDVNPRFLCDYINSSGGRAQMVRASNTTSGLNTISTGIVKSTEIIVPPKDLQDAYALIVDKARGNLLRQDSSRVLIGEAVFSLTQKAFSGQL